MERTSEIKNPEFTTYEVPKPSIAKYLVVVVDKDIASEVNHFTSLEEARQAFGEIAHDYGYGHEEINGSDRYDVSIWKWTEDRYEKVFE